MRIVFGPTIAVLTLGATVASAQAEEKPSRLTVVASYVADAIGNVDGGVARKGSYIDKASLAATLDGEATFGIPNFQIYAEGIWNDGQTISDASGQAQLASNIETGVQAVRLYALWAEKAFEKTGTTVRVGLYDLNSVFDSSPSRGVFINGAQGFGQDIGQAGINGPSTYPYSSLSVTVQQKLAEHWLLKAVVANGVAQNPDNPKDTVFRLKSSDGALVFGEVDYQPSDRKKFAIGYWRFTASFRDIETGGLRADNQGAYALFDVPLTTKGKDGAKGLNLFGRIGFANGHLNTGDWFSSGGLAMAPSRTVTTMSPASPLRASTSATRQRASTALTERKPLLRLYILWRSVVI